MNAVDFAFEQELQCEQYYREVAEITPVRAIQDILLMLAHAEKTHAKVLEQIRQKHPPILPHSAVLSNGRKIVRQLNRSTVNWDTTLEELELFEGMRDVAYQQEHSYLDMAAKRDNPLDKKTFQTLAQMEHNHFQLLDSICDLFAQHSSSPPIDQYVYS